MSKKVTIQQIAEELNLSRNTVSKALNGTGVLAPDTRKRILTAAMEMGYAGLASNIKDNLSLPISGRDVALMTSSMPLGAHWCSSILTAIEQIIRSYGLRLVIYSVQKNNLANLSLPQNFSRTQTCAIIGVELYGFEYTDMLCRLNLPTLFIDCTPGMRFDWPNADLLMMENINSISSIIRVLLEKKIRRFGFIGDPNHCQSFNDRYTSCCATVLNAGLDDPTIYSILDDDANPYCDASWLSGRLRLLPHLPQAFICANDSLAISTIHALYLLGKQVPKDILVSGFDNQPESLNILPPLTTVALYNAQMGKIGADMLLSRMRNPSIPARVMHVHTDPIFRGSTNN